MGETGERLRQYVGLQFGGGISIGGSLYEHESETGRRRELDARGRWPFCRFRFGHSDERNEQNAYQLG